ncbi:MAG: hypothetical protein EXS36_04685 [Pedosphaera sp.]|nr:hypothetical protein [Pedosphaera sp.]
MDREGWPTSGAIHARATKRGRHMWRSGSGVRTGNAGFGGQLGAFRNNRKRGCEPTLVWALRRSGESGMRGGMNALPESKSAVNPKDDSLGRKVSMSRELEPAAWALILFVALLNAGFSAHADREWHPEGRARWAVLDVPAAGRTGFELLSPGATGVTFTNFVSEQDAAANRVLLDGSGVAVGDFDRDGLPDLFFCGISARCILYRNLGGFLFKDVTAESGLPLEGRNYRGAVFADLNGDSWPDLLLSALGRGVLCFMNDGHGHFTNATATAGTGSSFGSMTLALADVDGNGTLDLYVANGRAEDIRDRGQVDLPLVKGRMSIPPLYANRLLIENGQVLEYGEPDQLFLNSGTGHFTPVPWTNGTFLDENGKPLSRPPLDWGLSATFRDINCDGAPDLYVCNDFWTPDRIWLNDGRGHFRAMAKLAIRHTSSSSMGVDFADLDRDGYPDFLVVDMLSRDLRLRKRQMWAQTPETSPIGAIDNRPQVMRNTLFHNRGDGTFAEIADFSGLSASDWSWQPLFIDVDLDGFEDLMISAGHFKDVQDRDSAVEIRARQRSRRGITNAVERQRIFTSEMLANNCVYPDLALPLVAFRNRGALKFEETTSQWGTAQPGVHHGMALTDLDGDGDLDLVVNNLGTVAGVYNNTGNSPRVAVRLRGKPPNTDGIGAKVILRNGAVPYQSQEVVSGGRYLSGSESLLAFAAGGLENVMTIEVQWRDNRRSTVGNVCANRLYEIDEDGSEFVPATSAVSVKPLFQDITERLGHTHHQPVSNDFERQPLLPFQVSHSGPAVVWCDLDGDRRDELILGGEPGELFVVYRFDGRSGFSRFSTAADLSAVAMPSGILGWTSASGRASVLTSFSGYSGGVTHAARSYSAGSNSITAGVLFADGMTSGGTMALGDIDGTGDLALFVAGGVSPRRYPLGEPSRIFRDKGGRWELDTRNSAFLAGVGIVNGAVWSDLTGDGLPELVLACEWGPIRVFQKQQGALFEITENLGLSSATGLWKGVTTGDFDGDGRMDIVAANWGMNSGWQPTSAQPLRLVYGELTQPGVADLIEAAYDPVLRTMVPTRSLTTLAAALPFLADQFPTHRLFSEAGLTQVLGDRKPLCKTASATTLESSVFLNRGDHFERRALPLEAQLAPAFGVSVADFDGDGNEDLFLSQNFFATAPETARMDGGRGLVLGGDGRGDFSAMSAARSGVNIAGEQRGSAVCDFDGDGRMDLVVGQNGAATRVFRNDSSKAGLRIQLKGPVNNSSGIGAVLRAQSGDRLGPAHEIHAGSGYASQDSSTMVLGTSAQPMTVNVRWSGGRVTITQVPQGLREVILGANGEIVSKRKNE